MINSSKKIIYIIYTGCSKIEPTNSEGWVIKKNMWLWITYSVTNTCFILTELRLTVNYEEIKNIAMIAIKMLQCVPCFSKCDSIIKRSGKYVAKALYDTVWTDNLVSKCKALNAFMSSGESWPIL